MSKTGNKTRPRPFTGILAQSFDEPDDLGIAVLAHGQPEPIRKAIRQAVDEYVANQKMERLVALAEYYGVDLQRRTPSPVLELLFRLAADFVPGFRPKDDPRNERHVGRPRHRSYEENLELFAAIGTIISRRGVSALSACAIISKDRKSPWNGRGAPALYERYKRFKAQIEIQRKERKDNPLYARISEIKRAGSRATPLTRIRN